jgi:hypothetical protein
MRLLQSGHALRNGWGRSSWSRQVAWARIAWPPPSMAPWRLASTLHSSGDTMAAAWVQKIARWDGFPSSQFDQINSPKRKTLGTSLPYSNFPENFLYEEGSRKGANRVKPGWTAAGAPTRPVRPGRPAHPISGADPVRFGFPFTAFFRFLSPWKKLAQ